MKLGRFEMDDDTFIIALAIFMFCAAMIASAIWGGAK